MERIPTKQLSSNNIPWAMAVRYKFIVLFFIISLTSSFHSKKALVMEKPEIIYVFDVMCGWCYGFSPVMQKIKEEYQDKATFTIVSGGLAIGERAAPVKEKFGYIKGALSVVEDRAGVKFGKGFKDLLEEGSYIYNSEPPSRALAVVKDMKPEIAFEYANNLHHLIFFEGKSLNDERTYTELAKAYTLDEHEFSDRFNSPEYLKKVYEEFGLAKSLGVTGFPTLILKKDGQYHILARGYTDYKSIDKQLQKLIF
jgi:putative protein-disulfide isomerase